MTYDPTNHYNLSSMDQLNRIEPAYLASFGLTETPFSLQLDDRFLYLSTAHAERLELLKHYTQYGNLLLIVTGERGIGKSSLKQRFINTAQEEWQICEIQSHTKMNASLLLKQVANGFGITEPPLEPAALFEVLNNQLGYMHQASYVPILIIDDAHQLPQDSLQSLLYLAEHHSEQETALRIILFCEPEIEIMLDDPAVYSLKERVTHSMEIPPLDETETAEYLRHRLAVAGLDGTSPFTPKLVHKIYKASEGLPSKINEYAHQNLLDDTEPSTTLDDSYLDDELIHETTSFNLRNIMLGGFALLILITGLLFQDSINRLFEEPASASETTKIEKPVIDKPAEEKTIEFSLNKVPEEKIKKPTKSVAPAIEHKSQHVALTLSSINPNPVPTSKQRQIISISGTGFHKRQKVKVHWTDKQKILANTQVTVSSDTYMNLILNVGMQSDKWKVTVIDPLTKTESNTLGFNVVAPEKEKISSSSKITQQKTPSNKVTTAKLKPEQLTGMEVYGPDWIRQQDKDYFTLQLLGTHQKSTLPGYLKKFALKNDAAIFKTKRDNKDWFTLIYGRYPTKATAQTAAKKLPKGVTKPWIRSFASILPSLGKKPLIKNTPAIVTASTIPDNQEGWLWSQDPSHYTLQLAAGTDKKAIQALINQYQLKGKAVYFHQVRDGKDWYILVHGSYSDYSKAKQSINQLPPAIQKAKPWVRQFSAIHAELN